MSNFAAWAKKASEINKKYDNHKFIITNKLISTSDSSEIFVLLYLFKRVVEMQEQISKKLNNGLELRTSLDKINEKDADDFISISMMIKDLIKKLDDVFEKESDILLSFRQEFLSLEQRVDLKDVEGGIFFNQIGRNELQKVSEYLLGFTSKINSSEVKKIKKEILSEFNYEKDVKSELKKVFSEGAIRMRKVRFWLAEKKSISKDKTRISLRSDKLDKPIRTMHTAIYVFMIASTMIIPEIIHEFVPIWESISNVF